ncbi:hypothetical protein M427DRAFT_244943 [Gonapodya prolifera JEL478]|uniref:Radical SAM core domain-containing protein n=1 Tax=Gonapodya prolifera (strain JEL478) TaxID=1344416 RepID=A0A139AM18_GONPJ|nr:hypothetical protein M427DRAFT_244943 [Gonapodya prolifera JEL478]|eukprot:KXS17738.1 hypothetical protein M427DRAFT_244943 [Gonapodya prolifera JEL478]
MEALGCQGYVHSTESMACLEGPGIRFLVFLSGCPSRCVYCENPDTWSTTAGSLCSVRSVLEKVRRTLPYMGMPPCPTSIDDLARECASRSDSSTTYRDMLLARDEAAEGPPPSRGGLSVSGGEPLTQHTFAASIMSACKRLWGMHTVLETTGRCSLPRVVYPEVLPWTDLVLLCIKGTRREKYESITRVSGGWDHMLSFLTTLHQMRKPWWCRYVVLPGHTDSREDVDALLELCVEHGKGLVTEEQPQAPSERTLGRVECLAYHNLGEFKWHELNEPYPLADVPQCNHDDVRRVCEWIREGLRSHGMGDVAVTGDD